MKRIINAAVCVMVVAIVVVSCATTRRDDVSGYNFSTKDTLSIFLLNNEHGPFFCIPIQYAGEYQISSFEFTNGEIQIGDYSIPLQRDEVRISVYLNETADQDGNTIGDFNTVYLENNGSVTLSTMSEPLAAKTNPEYTMNQYDIFIERYLSDDEMKNITGEYDKGNVQSKYAVWYDIVIDGNAQNGSGVLDDFELYSGPANEYEYLSLFPNLEFFRSMYLTNEY